MIHIAYLESATERQASPHRLEILRFAET